MSRSALHTYIESFGIKNFSIAGNQVRMGSRLWQADECRCGLKECEGWEMISKNRQGIDHGLARRTQRPTRL
jgi:hypothetical protein